MRWKLRMSDGLAMALVLSGLTGTAAAQQASGIAGLVRDSSGLAMPGVSVEAASPALIEKVRSVSTDGEGRYSIVDLRPGEYTVTFTLTGFTTIRREGIVLNAGFTASVNIAMQVGSLSETVTVSGAAPIVDTSSARQQQTLTDSQLEALPSGSIGLQTLAYVTPGFAASQADVGGTRDTWSAQGNYTLYHGKAGTRASFDGFRNQYFIGAASGVGYITDSGNIQELQLETSGMGAEAGSGSVSLNAIPKSGSNTFAGGLDGYFSNGAMQSSNLRSDLNRWALGDASLLAVAGIDSAAEVDRIYRVGGQFGGPIVQDKIWFFTALARWGSTVNQPGAYYNPLQGRAGIGCAAGFTPDNCTPLVSQVTPGTIGNVGPTPTLFYPGQPGTPFANVSYAQAAAMFGVPLERAASFDWYRNHAGRITAQVGKSRFNVYGDIQKSCRCTTGPFTGDQKIESATGWDWYPSGVIQGTWTLPVTSRLLLEAGASWQTANWVNFTEKGVTQYDRGIVDLGTFQMYAAPYGYAGPGYAIPFPLTAPVARTGRSAERFSMSYVTGTHNIKAGFTDEQGFNDEGHSAHAPIDGLYYDFLNGSPIRLDYFATPYVQKERQTAEIGVFAQDAWKIQRVTLNLGLRWDYVKMGYPEASVPATLYVPARHVTALSGIPTWKDINPRVGAAWDLFGNGRTAVKASVGRYNQLSRSDLTRRFHPFSSSITAASRSWNDVDGDYIPDCDVTNFGANGECGQISNANFGSFAPGASADCPSAAACFDQSVTKHNRDYLWDVNLELQHEVLHGLSVNAAYNHNWDGSFTVTQKIGLDGKPLGPDAYDEFCTVAPTDSRLATSGQQLCGFYDLKPEFFGQYTYFVTNAKNLVGQFGNTKQPARHWDGFTFGVNGRLPRDIRLGGGVDIGRQVDDHCFTVNAPNQPVDINGSDGSQTVWNGFNTTGAGNCRVVTAWSDNLDVRLNGSVPITGGFAASFIYRSTPGAVLDAYGVALPDTITFKNGRDASTLTAVQVINLTKPAAHYGVRFSQLDLSVSKQLNLGWSRLHLALDVYNALNSNSIQRVQLFYGSIWLKPSSFLDPRLARLTASLQF